MDLLIIGGFLIFLVPLLWIFSSNIIYLFVIELFSGVIWAGFNLASGNYIFDAVTREKRHLCVAYLNVLRGIGIFIGSILGGYLATIINLEFMNTILFLFLVSAVLRLSIAFIFLPRLREVRQVKKWSMYRAIHYHPLQGRHGFMRGLLDWVYFPLKRNAKR